jgi:hypothetical protein
MGFRITPPTNPILGPIMAFGVVWLPASMIMLPLIEVFHPLPSSTRRLILLAIVLVAAVVGSAYSWIYACKQTSHLSQVDRGVYYLFWPIVFFAIFGFGFYLS